MKTVFFGPFIGEFGWELLYWQGWVRKVCKNEYKDYRKIASSFPGREAFYPYVDEFWPHSKEILSLKISNRNYITDFWKNGFPRLHNLGCKDKSDSKYPNFGDAVGNLLNKYKQRLPDDTLYYVPFRMNHYERDKIKFGVEYPENPNGNKDFITESIPFKYQCLEPIVPTDKGRKAFEEIYTENKKLIAIFPRCRKVRRPDKNWSREKYDVLINLLQKHYGERYKIAIFGEPGGAFYTDRVPQNTLDLINVSPELRMDIQVAALKRAVLALGSMSGAILFALACGAPAITWGDLEQMSRYYKENFLGTKFIYYPEMKVSPRKIFKFCSVTLDNKNSLFVCFVPFVNTLSCMKRVQNRFLKKIKAHFSFKPKIK